MRGGTGWYGGGTGAVRGRYGGGVDAVLHMDRNGRYMAVRGRHAGGTGAMGGAGRAVRWEGRCGAVRVREGSTAQMERKGGRYAGTGGGRAARLGQEIGGAGRYGAARRTGRVHEGRYGAVRWYGGVRALGRGRFGAV